jgi:hypothetical protein
MRSWHGCNPNKQGEDVAVPMASLPTGMSGRNWMLRRLLVESIRRDPAWNSGNYTTQPPSLQLASVFFATATSGGNHSYMKAGPNVPASEQTLGHGMTGNARFWKQELEAVFAGGAAPGAVSLAGVRCAQTQHPFRRPV